MGRTTSKSNQVDTLGNVAGADLVAGYQVANKEEGTTSYYGYVDSSGNWYVQRVTATDIDFSAGTSNYTTNWTNRTSLVYGKFNTIF